MRFLFFVLILFLAACSDDPESPPASTSCLAGTAGEGCEPCEAGYYCDGENAAAICADGTWDDDADPSSPCVSWGTCEPGNGSAVGTSTTDGTCTPCESGSFSDGNNACSPWSRCTLGQRLVSEGSVSSDRVCEACPSGTFSTSENAATCEVQTACLPGTYVQTAGSSTTDQICASCASGTFSTSENAAACESWTVCEAGAFVATA